MEATKIEKKIYTLDNNAKFKFRTYVLLQEIIQYKHYFPIVFGGDDRLLEGQLRFMFHNELLDKNEKEYIPTEKGREYLQNFLNKYYEFLKIFDVFSAVDLGTGEFAFSKFYDMTEDEWKPFINLERFSDVRIAVAEFKKLDAVEIVFMSFMNENKFDPTLPNWQDDLISDVRWNEILNICNTAIPLVDLQDNGVIEDIIAKGNETMKALAVVEKALDEKEFEASQHEKHEYDDIVETTTTETVEEEVTEYVPVIYAPVYGYGYWDSYYADPYYMSPFWYTPILFY